MKNFKIAAFTHRSLEMSELGKLHLEEHQLEERLLPVKSTFGLEEIMVLSTCNRVEFLFSYEGAITDNLLGEILEKVYPSRTKNEISFLVEKALVFEGEDALVHLFNVASSLDSLVVGEREIITQVRNAYEHCHNKGLTGDLLRLVVQKTIECAKQVYTQTNVAKNPVSVVSLAYRKLKELNVTLDSRFIIVGAGITNTGFSRFLKKHGFTNFVIFNRTPEKGEKLGKELGAISNPLSELKNYHLGFDVIVTCTGASGAIITREIYESLVGEDKRKKIVIDLAVPNDLDEEILKLYDVNLIAINHLQEIAGKNLKEREKELSSCMKIVARNIIEFEGEYKERRVELAMREVPRKVKEIRERAFKEVFARDIEKLDDNSKETLEKMMAYFEKKYISVPIKMAKEILIGEVSAK